MGKQYVKTALNLRSGPGIGYGVVTVLPKGTAVTIEDDCDCRWVPVRYGNRIGYLRTSYLSRNKVLSRKRNFSFSHARRGVRYYTNTYGNRVQSPTIYNDRPAGATALCRDGRIALARVEEVHARIMVVWRDGINVINILLCQKSEFQE